MLTFQIMDNSIKEINKLRANSEASLIKTAALQQFLAKLEASLTRKETQKVEERTKGSNLFVTRSFKP